MISPDRSRPPLVIPPAWRSFLRSGRYTGARASVRAGDSEVPLNLTARLEFIDGDRLAIELALAGSGSARASAGSPGDQLTARERTVIALIAMGRETQEIAEALYVSPSTVRTHVRNAMAKLGAHTRAQLVAVAMSAPEAPQLTRTEEGGGRGSAAWGIERVPPQADH